MYYSRLIELLPFHPSNTTNPLKSQNRPWRKDHRTHNAALSTKSEKTNPSSKGRGSSLTRTISAISLSAYLPQPASLLPLPSIEKKSKAKTEKQGGGYKKRLLSISSNGHHSPPRDKRRFHFSEDDGKGSRGGAPSPQNMHSVHKCTLSCPRPQMGPEIQPRGPWGYGKGETGRE